jgi:hypothetical protein
MKFVARLLITVGNTLTALGCVGLGLAITGLISIDRFWSGPSSGIRVIGSVAVAGCLLSAAGYGYEEHQIGLKE